MKVKYNKDIKKEKEKAESVKDDEKGKKENVKDEKTIKEKKKIMMKKNPKRRKLQELPKRRKLRKNLNLNHMMIKFFWK